MRDAQGEVVRSGHNLCFEDATFKLLLVDWIQGRREKEGSKIDSMFFGMSNG